MKYMNRSLHSLTLLMLGILLTACSSPEPESAAATLPALGASESITVSGLSAGGYMAGQYQVAYSASVRGAAIAAAGPWACSQGSLNKAIGDCISAESLDVDPFLAQLGTLASAGAIDAPSNLTDDRVLLFHGSADTVIGGGVNAALQQWLASTVNEANIKLVTDVDAPHGWPITESSAECQSFAAPYINPCGYDLAGEILAHAYGELKEPDTTSGELLEFSQSGHDGAELADSGYVFVPNDCRTNPGCDVHVFFHGCEQSAVTVGDAVVRRVGFNRWAASNRLIVLYPQIAPSSMAPMNPLGCWDWWGYTGDNFLEKSAPQLSAVQRMVKQLQTGAE